LHDYFSQFGKVLSAYGLKNAATGKNKGFGFVEFDSIQEAQNVLKVKLHLIDGVRISCSPYMNKRQVKISNPSENHSNNTNSHSYKN
jgi:hypothetical protein